MSAQDTPATRPMGQDSAEDKAKADKKKAKEEANKKAKEAKMAKLALKEQKQKEAAAQAQGKQKDKEKKKKDEEKLPPYQAETTGPTKKKVLKPLDDQYHKAYIPSVVESAWYDWWQNEGFHKPEFKADGNVKDAGYFVITIPPPNVTGKLHIGHALATSLQDAMIRWNRMLGKTVLYVPGCDHAGISTQSVVENMMYKINGQTRHDLGRPKFVQEVWKWKTDYHEKINSVLKRLGASVDWDQEAFTMDDTFSAAVRQTFVQLHDEGLIYRANRLVNWCCKLETALSNLEVDQKELEGSTKIDVPGYDKKIEFGSIWMFKYPVEGTDRTIHVATTRPETMLGDTGVAVHPDDERYKDVIGKKVKHPFVDRLLPIFGDETVDREFGTGAVKITPAHDFNDFRRGKEHSLKFVNILNDDGTMNDNAGIFKGQKRFDVRYGVIAELEKLGLYVGKENNKMSIPMCSKSKDVIEPILKPQWWMHMKPLAGPALEVVKQGKIKIKPQSAESNYYRWMENVDDWCLSRQLWWGHQIPAWYVKMDNDQMDADEKHWVCAQNETEALEKAKKKFGRDFEPKDLERDADCLDTWFSSGLWPFSTLGWPNTENQLYQKLYPTTFMETGWDILFFWVARMVFFGLKLTGKVPFEEVYCHSLIRDSEGRKMSKSLGNVIDPVDIMDGITLDALTQKLKEGNLAPKEVERASKWQRSAFPDGIDECGADALRFSLINYTTGGGDINFDVKVMRSYRNFCNKIYQATKYVLGNLPESFQPASQPPQGTTLPERWLLHKLTHAARKVNTALAAREFAQATQAVHNYWIYELCDVFIENSKFLLREGTERESVLQTLYTGLDGALRLMHPFMPFLTEELWQRLPRREGDVTPSIVLAPFPTFQPKFHNPEAEASYERILGCARGIRSLVQEYKIKEGGRAVIQTTQEIDVAAVKALAGKQVSEIFVGRNVPEGKNVAGYSVSADANVFLVVKEWDSTREGRKIAMKVEAVVKEISAQRRVIDALPDTVSEEVKEKEMTTLRDLEAEEEMVKALAERVARL
ncbi:hypothetical protein K470DRAFT_255512 [Piedraia hortae CBS 480.64]|uniref:valine--tRNA ligase n=1 Tax=Piedraia hortae CBS 480.64 TaxID=1314780 RepID=A0A6A7C8N7_9PEZI|nr:hypothetical protein K470DRAFT_255512 [Piedraia hortae CBS 480.64]